MTEEIKKDLVEIDETNLRSSANDSGSLPRDRKGKGKAIDVPNQIISTNQHDEDDDEEDEDFNPDDLDDLDDGSELSDTDTESEGGDDADDSEETAEQEEDIQNEVQGLLEEAVELGDGGNMVLGLRSGTRKATSSSALQLPPRQGESSRSNETSSSTSSTIAKRSAETALGSSSPSNKKQQR